MIENKAFISNIVFIFAQSFKHPYRRYTDFCILIEPEQLTANYNAFYEPPPMFADSYARFQTYAYAHCKDSVHYISVMRFFRQNIWKWNLFDWQYAIHLLETYYEKPRVGT